MTPGFVHQVQAEHSPIGDLQHLQGQVQVALQASGVDHDDRPPTEEELLAEMSRGRVNFIGPGHVVYETMWGSTREMARAIVEGIAQAGVEEFGDALLHEEP